MAIRKVLFLDPTFGFPTEASNADAIVAGMFTAAGVGGVAFDAGNNRIIGLPEPTSANEPVTKGMLDRLEQGVTQISSVRVLASGNQTLSGLPSIDGVQLVAGDRILLIGQSSAVQNGVWVVATGQWARPVERGISDWTTGRSCSSLAMFVREGVNYADQGYICITDGAPKVDTDPVTFTQYTGLGEVTAGLGLAKSTTSGNTISAVLASASGLQFTAGAFDTLLNPTGALAKDANGLAVKVSTDNTLAADASGLKTKGLPNLFTVGGTATSANVSAANLSTLTGGTSSLADALHQHTNVLQAQTVVHAHTSSVALNAGDPVQWSNTNDLVTKSDASNTSSAQCIGIALTAIGANASGPILKRGVAVGVFSGGSAGQPVYLAANGGGLTSTLPSASGASIVRIGTLKNASDLDVMPAFIGTRSAG